MDKVDQLGQYVNFELEFDAVHESFDAFLIELKMPELQDDNSNLKRYE